MRADQARTISIASYLEISGVKPVRARREGKELWYNSPIRSGDNSPSFKVDTDKNLWYDHGAAKGGNIIDLVLEQYQCSVSDALHRLERSGLTPHSSWSGSFGVSRENLAAPAGENKKSETALELVDQRELAHPALLQYLEGRRIDLNVAKHYCSEIHFKAPQSAKSFFGVGYPAGSGFEARSTRFKGFVGTSKNVTHHDNGEVGELLLFEGFIDFLTYLTAKRITELSDSAVVLNSTNLWRRAVPLIENRNYRAVRLFLDNDQAGDEVTTQLSSLKQAPPVLDMRLHYGGQNDLNAWWMMR